MIMQDLIIRTAVREDCPRLLELVKELAIYEKAPDEVTVSLEHFEDSGFGEKPVWWAFVATVPDPGDGPERIIAGFALYYIRYSTWKGQTMYLEDILVTESMRGQGIGQQLFNRLMEEAREKGFKRVTWQVLDWNEPAINFYRRQGAKLDPEWLNATIDL
jgi:GNAT superfamily N-acetyltransferase